MPLSTAKRKCINGKQYLLNICLLTLVRLIDKFLFITVATLINTFKFLHYKLLLILIGANLVGGDGVSHSIKIRVDEQVKRGHRKQR